MEAAGRQVAQVRELLDLEVLVVDADAVRLPQQRGVPGLAEVASHVGVAAVQARRVGADDLDAPADEPARGVGAESGVVVPVGRRAEALVVAEAQADDLAGRQRCAGGLDGGGELVDLDADPRSVPAEVDDEAWREEVPSSSWSIVRAGLPSLVG